MNIEILSATISSDSRYTFTFSQPVNRFFIGFSKCIIQFPRPDHHVKEMSIDLRDFSKNQNEVTIIPKLRLRDRHDNSESSCSSITIVVLASIGEGNPYIHINNNVNINHEYILPWDQVNFVNSSLSYSYVRYYETDHHVQKLMTYIYPSSEEIPICLKGIATIVDKNCNFDRRDPLGNLIAFCGKDGSILHNAFSSRNIGRSGSVNLGAITENFSAADYISACFINSYTLSFESNDHHVLKVELSSQIEYIYEQDGNLYAKVNLTSFLTDNGKNYSQIPHNEISGFIIAYNKNAPQEKSLTLREFANSYNSLSSSLVYYY